MAKEVAIYEKDFKGIATSESEKVAVRALMSGNVQKVILNARAVRDFYEKIVLLEKCAKWYKENCRLAFEQALDTGETIEGFRMQGAGNTRTVTDTRGFIEQAAANYGTPQERLWDVCTITLKKASEVTGVTEERLAQELSDYVEIKPKAATLKAV